MKCTKKPDKKRFLRYFSYILLLVLIVGTYYLLLSELDGASLIGALNDAHLGVLGIGFLFVLGYIFFEGAAIRTICRSLGVKFSYLAGFRYACVELYFSAVTPSSTGGQPLMVYYMCREGAPVAASSIAVLINTIAYALTTIGFTTFALIFEWDAIFGMGTFFVIAVVLGCFTCVMLITGCALCLFSERLVLTVCTFFIRLLCAIRLMRNLDAKVEKLRNLLRELRAGAEHVYHHPHVFVRALGENCMQRFCYLAVSYCVYRSFGLAGASIVTVMLLQMVMTIPAYSIPLPGGVGITELMFLDLYAGLYLVESQLNAAMILTRGLNHYLCILFCGVVVIVTHFYSGRKQKRMAQSTDADTSESAQP